MKEFFLLLGLNPVADRIGPLFSGSILKVKIGSNLNLVNVHACIAIPESSGRFSGHC